MIKVLGPHQSIAFALSKRSPKWLLVLNGNTSAKRVSGVRNHHRHPGSHRHDRRHDPGTCSPRPRFKANGSGIRAGLTLRHEAHKVYVQIGRHLTEVGPGDDANGMSSTPPPPLRQSKRHWLNGRHRWTHGDAPSGSGGNPRSGDAPRARPIGLDAEERFARYRERRREDGRVGGSVHTRRGVAATVSAHPP